MPGHIPDFPEPGCAQALKSDITILSCDIWNKNCPDRSPGSLLSAVSL
uniref:Uncharacterized protein n=1 Tax=Faecalibaculum rodentium TaxID=1702221 RepID=A0A140DYH8_9FIRM|nr:hypothetical protein AALO17_25710 [Faecalibaculum rodentium]